MKRKIVVLSGAGISAESGIKTFRDADGLWEGYDIMAVASPEGFRKHPEVVLDFYNQRRRQLLEVVPNAAHLMLAQMQDKFELSIVTQNVDDLHERAGSKDVIHLHGELLKVRSVYDEKEVYEWYKDLSIGDLGASGHQLRPHIVWFGEEVPLMECAARVVAEADILLIIGTSMQVYPAAGLIHYSQPTTPIYYIDANPAAIRNVINPLTVIAENATSGVLKVFDELLNI